MPLIKPARLRKGEVIGLVSPAGTPRPAEKIGRAVKYLEGLGYRTEVGKNAGKEYGYLAGTDAERADDLNGMIRDKRVKAIFALRGGYGCGRILGEVDYVALRKSPKIIVGFSDITALQLAIYRKCKLVTFSGPMPAVELWKEPDPFTEENFWPLITSTKTPGVIETHGNDLVQSLVPGKGTGAFLGGNLSILVSMLGTPFCPSFEKAILVMEEVDEAPYRVDRMLAHLCNTGVADALRGLVFGQFTRCVPKDASTPGFTVEEVLREFAVRVGKPALSGLTYGHIPRKLTIPFGAKGRIDADQRRLEVLEGCVV